MAGAAEHLTADQKKRLRALQESHVYASAAADHPEIQELLKRPRKASKAISREEFQRRYLAR